MLPVAVDSEVVDLLPCVLALYWILAPRADGQDLILVLQRDTLRSPRYGVRHRHRLQVEPSAR